jgi:hypothetical protein
MKNLWFVAGGVTWQTKNASNADLRGGPALRYPGSFSYWAYAATDRRKKLYFDFGPSWQYGFDHYLRNVSLSADIIYRPVNALNVSLAPNFTWNTNQVQYVATVDEQNVEQYVVAQIDQTIASVSMRVTYMITPNLSVQYWGQPFGSSGIYSNYKRVTSAGAPSYTSRFALVSADALIRFDDQYQVDQDHDGVADFTFTRPDFNVGQFRSNMVIRWEYIPGSTVFLVWTQENNGAFYNGQPDRSPYSFDFPDKAHNIFLMKYTYRFRL